MLTLQLVIAVIVFVLILLFDMIHPLLSGTALFLLFMWGALVFDYTPIQKLFYPIGIVFFIAIRANLGNKLQTSNTRTDVNGPKAGGVIAGLQYHIFTIGIGAVMLVVMFAMSSVKGQILNVAPLSIGSGGFSAWATTQFAPAISLALGFIENRMFIAALVAFVFLKDPLVQVFNAILANPITGVMTAQLTPFIEQIAILLPVIITSLAFGLFHIIAYSMSATLILWAAAIMAMWIGSYYLTGRDTTAMDFAHGGWNGWLTSQQTLSFAF